MNEAELYGFLSPMSSRQLIYILLPSPCSEGINRAEKLSTPCRQDHLSRRRSRPMLMASSAPFSKHSKPNHTSTRLGRMTLMIRTAGSYCLITAPASIHLCEKKGLRLSPFSDF